MFTRLSDAEMRDHCRSRLESLELWLRRLIDDLLTASYGENYFDYVDNSGNRAIKRQIVESLDKRRELEPGRYPRRVDAILLDDSISIVCNPTLYTQHFRVALKDSFPGGVTAIREMLERITHVRNRLAHANPISVQDAARVVCYTGDVIESLRAYFQGAGMNNEYNVPTIIRMTDSFGNRFHRNQLIPVHDGGIMCILSRNAEFNLRPGDTYTIEVEIDPAFDPSTYKIRWASIKPIEGITDQPKFVLPITTSWVGAMVDIQCWITSNKNWHRMGMGTDDFLSINIKVLPPLD